MFLVTIKNAENEITHSAKFETEELANAWVAENRVTYAWGKPDRWVSDLDIEKMGEDRALAQDTNQIDDIMFFRFPETFTVDIEDTSAADTFNSLVDYAKEAQAHGAYIMAMIKAMGDLKFVSGEMTSFQFQLLLDDVGLKQAERLLWMGALESAKALIQSLNQSFFSNDDKSKIIGEIDSFLTKHGRGG